MPESQRAPFIKTALSLPRPDGWETLRKEAAEKIRTSPLPANNQEEWKYLDLSSVFSKTFVSAKPSMHPPPFQTPDGSPAETAHSTLVFTNGQFDPALSDTGAVGNGIHFAAMDGSTKGMPDICNQIGKLAAPASSDIFANINTACFDGAAIVHVPAGLSPEAPLRIVFRSIGPESGGLPIIFPRILVALGAGAKAHLVEEYFGSGKYLTASVVEIFLGEGAALRHDRVQRESPDAFHFCTLHADLGEFASYTSTSISLGAAISRHSPAIAFRGEHAELELNGLSLLNAHQTSDTHSLIDHAVPECTSRQLQKYIVDGSAHGIFNGRIMVQKDAQRTDAGQSSRSLLLTEQARIDAKPQLEIYADDVKCSHGATVGQLDAEELFYLQSRGLDLDAAKNLLLLGFSADIINRLALPSHRRGLLQSVLDRAKAAY